MKCQVFQVVERGGDHCCIVFNIKSPHSFHAGDFLLVPWDADPFEVEEVTWNWEEQRLDITLVTDETEWPLDAESIKSMLDAGVHFDTVSAPSRTRARELAELLQRPLSDIEFHGPDGMHLADELVPE